jgi:uncharacterized protein
MNIVLDTNVLVVAISRNSPYNPIFQALLANRYHLYITNEILLEYTEIMQARSNAIITRDVLDALVTRRNVHFVNFVYYNWQLSPQDPDDNKFIDCAVIANADFLVTNDKHYKAAKNNPFPTVNVITAAEFLAILKA